MIMAGVYQKGANAEVDSAIDKHDEIEKFLCQEEDEHCTIEDTLQKLSALVEIEIPESEYDENPAASRKTVAELVHKHKEEKVEVENAKAGENFSGAKVAEKMSEISSKLGNK